jgi:hypothetical protein
LARRLRQHPVHRMEQTARTLPPHHIDTICHVGNESHVSAMIGHRVKERSHWFRYVGHRAAHIVELIVHPLAAITTMIT